MKFRPCENDFFFDKRQIPFFLFHLVIIVLCKCRAFHAASFGVLWFCFNKTYQVVYMEKRIRGVAKKNRFCRVQFQSLRILSI